MILIVNASVSPGVERDLRPSWLLAPVLAAGPSGRARLQLPGAVAEIGADAVVALEPAVPAAAFFAAHGLVPVRALWPTRGTWLVRDGYGWRDGLAVARGVLGREGVRFAEPDLWLERERSSISVPPNDPRYSGQWYLRKINIEQAWATTTGSPSVTVQVIDNGCEMTHPDLSPHVLPGTDVVDGDDDPSVVDTDGAANHGTACAGIIAAVGDNGVGIAGTCPECKVRCVRMLGGSGVMVPISADVDAMRFALQHDDVAVVSNSWSFKGSIQVPQSLRQAIEDVSRQGRGGKGAVVVFAAGNDNRELQAGELYSIPEVVTVGAINNFDEAAPFSNHGLEVDLTAPTGSVTLDLSGDAGSDPGDYTSLFGGTSSACPVVAGVAALMVSAKPEATGAEVREALVRSVRKAPFAATTDGGHDPLYGYGIVSPGAALARLLGRLDAGPMVLDAGVDAGAPAVVPAVPDPLGPAGSGCSAAPWGVSALLLVVVARAISTRGRG